MDGALVLGAGLAGLGSAKSLPGARLFEASDHVGGHAYSHPMNGYHFDQGAHISHSKDPVFRRMADAAAGDVHVINPCNVQNLYRGDWIGYPVQNNLYQLPPKERIAALSDFVAARIERQGEAAHYDEWCRRQYGDYLTETFYHAYTRKYWRVPPDSLSTDWLGGRLVPSQIQRIIAGAVEDQTEDQLTFSKFHYPKMGGFFAFFEPLYDGIDVHLNHRAVEIDPVRKRVHFSNGRSEHYERLISTIPLPTLVDVCKDVPAGIVRARKQLAHTQLLCVNIIVSKPKAAGDLHWFYLYDMEIEASRVSVPSNLAPNSALANTTALQAEVFRRHDEPVDVESLVENTLRKLGKILGFHPVHEVHSVGHRLVPFAYVISNHQRKAAVDEILGWFESHGVESTGLYGRWKYVWSDRAFELGRQAGLRRENAA